MIAQMVELVRSDLRPIVSSAMEREHPELWARMSPRIREMLFERIDAQLP